MKVELKALKTSDKEAFITENQRAFLYGATEEFGSRDDHFESDGQIISRQTIEKSIADGVAYRIYADGKKVGGVVVALDGNEGELELLFVTPEMHGKGIGQIAWREIEKLHDNVTEWTTYTPYFEKRNIHFYVNCCGFLITEFFNVRHPFDDEHTDGSFDMFKFVKKIK